MGIVSKIVRQKSSWGFEAAPQNNPLLCLGSWDKCFPNAGPYHVENTLLVARPRRWHSLAAYTHPHRSHTPTPLTHTHTATRDGGDGRAGVVPVLSEEAKSNTLPGSGGRESRKSVGGKTLPRAWEISTLRAGEGESVCMYACVWREVGM